MTRAQRTLAAAIGFVGLCGLAVALLVAVAPREGTTTFTRPASVTAVEVDSSAGPVEVVPAEGREISVRRTTRYLVGEPQVADSVIAGVVRLRARCPGPIVAGCEVRHRVEVPASVSVRIRAVRGRVSVSGVTAQVDVVAGANRVALADISGPVRVVSSSGPVTGTGLAPPFLDATASSGPIRLSLARPPGRLDVTTGSGPVELTLPEARYRVETRTRSGRVDVAVVADATSPYVVRATTGSGPIVVRPG